MGRQLGRYNWIHQSKLDFLRPIRYPLVAQSGSWPLGLIPTLVLAGAVLGALGSALALRRYLRVEKAVAPSRSRVLRIKTA